MSKSAANRQGASNPWGENRQEMMDSQGLDLLGLWEWDLSSGEIIGSSQFYRILGIDTYTMFTRTFRRPEMVNGQPRAIYGISVDVTERRHPEEIMKAQNEMLSLIALGKPLSEILRTIAEQTNANLTGRFCSILLVDQERNRFANGISPGFPDANLESMVNKPINALCNPCSRAVYKQETVIVSDISKEPLWEQTVFKEKAENFGLKSIYAAPVLSSEQEVIAIFSLYSRIAGEPKPNELEMIEAFIHLTSLAIERNEYERKIRKLAFYDTLTGLCNRSYFTEQFEQRLKEAEQAPKKLALLYIGMDQFKTVNECLGHNAGDRLLVEAANRIKDCVGEEQLLARIEGDEFTLLLEDVASPEEALVAAETITECFRKPFMLQGHEFRIGLSIGISICPDHGKSVSGLMKQADIAMNKAKSEGRGRAHVYTSSYDAAMYEKFVLRTQLYKALAENQFVLDYQPRIELKSGAVRSMEALIRWKHPDMGLLPPSEFIALAEQSGFIVELGEWVIREACRQNKAWQEQGVPALRIAVNVSVQQFAQDSFVSRVRDILLETGVAPELLEIEITETALMHQVDTVISKLKQLNQMGIYVSVDDFGTGYSSLNYLKRFEVKSLKIDRSFIRDLTNDPKDEAITKMIIALAHSLQLEVIGEGVETEVQHALLLEYGCEHAQGYLYGKPSSAAAIEQKLHVYRGKIYINR